MHCATLSNQTPAMTNPAGDGMFLAVVRARLGITDPSWPAPSAGVLRFVAARRAAAAAAVTAEPVPGDTSARHVLEPQLEALGGTLSDRAPASLPSSQATAADDTAAPAAAVDYFAVRARIARLLAAGAVR